MVGWPPEARGGAPGEAGVGTESMARTSSVSTEHVLASLNSDPVLLPKKMGERDSSRGESDGPGSSKRSEEHTELMQVEKSDRTWGCEHWKQSSRRQCNYDGNRSINAASESPEGLRGISEADYYLVDGEDCPE